MKQFDLNLKHVFSYTATLTQPELIGPVPDNIRSNIYVTGGEVWLPDGKKIGKVKGVGGDWLTVRRDNTGVLDVRATVETFDGALLYAWYSGIVDMGEGGYDNLLKGKLPEKAQVRAAPQFCTSHPAYAWVNRAQFINVGEVFFHKGYVTYDTYAVR